MKMDCHDRHNLFYPATTRRRKRPRVNNHPERTATPTFPFRRRTALCPTTSSSSTASVLLLWYLSVTTTWTSTTTPAPVANAEQYYASAPTEAPVSVNKGVVQTQDFCTHNYIQVEKLSILCDTPGAYYYGSNAYRNSLVCMSGDKAHLIVHCEWFFSVIGNKHVEFVDALHCSVHSVAGNSPKHFCLAWFDFMLCYSILLLSRHNDHVVIPAAVRIPSAMDYDAIYLKTELGIYDSFQEAYIYGTTSNNDDDSDTALSICQMNVVQLQSDTSYYTDVVYGDPTECPFPGLYQLEAYYRVPAIRDYNFKYTPDIRLQFSNRAGRRIGCVVSGPSALHKVADRKAEQGLVALAIAVGLLLCLFGVLLLLSQRRKRRGEAKVRANSHAYQTQYVRTLPNGTVRPPATTVGPRVREQPRPIPEDYDEDDEEDDDPLQISNPEYNETHVPTRPII